MRPLKNLLLILLALLPLAGEAQRHDSLPGHLLPPVWPEDTLFRQQLPVEDTWWTIFGDAALDSLIRVAVGRNPSALQALLRMDMSRLNWRMQQGKLYPSLSLGGGWTRRKSSGTTPGGEEAWTGSWDASLSMNWEVDVAGSIRLRAKAGRENFMASREEYRAAMVSLCAEVATAYFNLRQYQQQLEVLRRNSASQKQVVDITETRFRTGLASKLDVAQAKSVYFSTLASIPSAEASIQQYLNSLATLTGSFPDEVRTPLAFPVPLPDYVEAVGTGVPANLLRRRPDIRAAERTVGHRQPCSVPRRPTCCPGSISAARWATRRARQGT